MSAERFKSFEEISRTLKSIAQKYSTGAPEYDALKIATFALFFAMTEHPDAFRMFVDDSGKELTLEQKAHLKELGLG